MEWERLARELITRRTQARPSSRRIATIESASSGAGLFRSRRTTRDPLPDRRASRHRRIAPVATRILLSRARDSTPTLGRDVLPDVSFAASEIPRSIAASVTQRARRTNFKDERQLRIARSLPRVANLLRSHPTVAMPRSREMLRMIVFESTRCAPCLTYNCPP